MAGLLSIRMQVDAPTPGGRLFPFHPPFRFALIISGFVSSDAALWKYYPQYSLIHGPIPSTYASTVARVQGTQSLHVYGENDTTVDPSRSLALIPEFENPEVYIHSGAHYVPTDGEGRQRLAQFMKQFLP
jgi:fermentation-respiration switch protein FrsA (DUF1100 family)